MNSGEYGRQTGGSDIFPPPGISTVVNTVSLPWDWDIDCEGIGGCPRQLGFIDRWRFSNNTTEHLNSGQFSENLRLPFWIKVKLHHIDSIFDPLRQ